MARWSRLCVLLMSTVFLAAASVFAVGYLYDGTSVLVSDEAEAYPGAAAEQVVLSTPPAARVGGSYCDDRSRLARVSARPSVYGLAPNTTREVIFDTNAVYGRQRAQGLLQAGDVPVITRTTQAEIRNLAAAGRMKPPGYLDDFAVIDDVMDVNTRINIRGALRPGQRGIFGDGSIGATAINRGSPVITFDRNFADVLRQFGVNVL